MAAQQPGQQKDQSLRVNQQRFQLHKLRWIIVIIVLILVAAGTVIWLLTLRGTWITIVPLVITVIGVIIALFQWLFPFSSNTSDHSSTTIPSSLVPQLSTATPSLSTMPEIHVHIPPADHTHPPQSGPLEKRAYRGIMGVPPPTDSRTIQQRETVVMDLCARLIQPDVTSVVLTGIGGVGKSTLAALIYRYAEEQRRTGNGPFAAEAIWLNIDPTVTFADLAGNLFEVLGKPLPDFTNLSLQHQAMTLLNVLNTPDQPRLVVLKICLTCRPPWRRRMA
jgi:hypothetical protein